jgi:threonylcarbamoyladenosine tRNA methylthiotransferase MtaB
MADNVTVTKRASLHTLGCRLNQSETLHIRHQLETKGYDIVPFGEPADLAIINTCTVTNLADTKCRQSIRSFTRKNPQAFTAVVGCYSESGASIIAEIPGVDLIIGNQEKLSVLDYIEQEKNDSPVIIRERINKDDFSIHFVGDVPFDKRANLKVQDGCDFMCSFCIIPFVRGRSRTREMENLLAEATALTKQGVRELILTGVNIGTYLSQKGENILAVIDNLNEIVGLDRIRISSIEPTTIPESLFDRMIDPKHALLPFLHIPLQSGCDRILGEMRRKYTVLEYLAFIHRARNTVPDLYIGTDIMVGFPGESLDEFDETCQIFQENPFDFCHVFPYSERDGTLAARREDQIPTEERARRSAHLRRMASSKRYEHYTAYLGKTMPVLFEDPKEGTWPGYTDNYIRVVIKADQAKNEYLANRMGSVRLNKISADFVSGDLLEMLD